VDFKVTKEKCIKLNEFLEKDDVEEYKKDDVVSDLDLIKDIYEVIVENNSSEKSVFYKATTMAEIDKIKNNSHINGFIVATTDISKAKEDLSNILNRPVLLQIEIDNDILCMTIEDNLIVIVPFTKLVSIDEILEDDVDYKIYKVVLNNQSRELLEDNVKTELYENILNNVDIASEKMKECFIIDEENSNYYENIRKLEQLIAKHHFAMEQANYEADTTEEEKQSDLDDINRINSELVSLKDMVTNSFNERLKNMQFISDWKLDIFDYLKNEFCEIEDKINGKTDKQGVEEEAQELEVDDSKTYKPTGNEEVDSVKLSSIENIETVETLINNIKDLISKQQNHARIADNLDSNYRALNNGFQMKNFAEELNSLVNAISNKVDNVEPDDKETLDKIAEVNVQISTLLNYLNNAKSAVSKKLNRFDELNILEENELKKEIAETIKNIRCEAELKKLNDDLDIIEDKSNIKKFIGRFTGRNKLDETMLDQIEVRQKAIRKNFKTRMPLAHNYSIHEIIAEIDMFIKENENDDLVVEDVSLLRRMKEILKKNFVIIDSKVVSIINQKSGKNLPLQTKKINKKEIIEIDTYRFLNRYGYDKSIDTNEPEYQDTVATEIKQIIDYIKSSEILE